jgi:hypothetical protein
MERYETLTMRDYFAANAPAEIPDWFRHEEPPRDYPPQPDWRDIKDREQAEIAANWLSDGCYDLPESLRWFAAAVKQHRDSREQWGRENAAERFFQWRWHYADMMIASRAESVLHAEPSTTV